MCNNSVDAQNMTVMDFMLHQYAVKLKTVYLHLIINKSYSIKVFYLNI